MKKGSQRKRSERPSGSTTSASRRSSKRARTKRTRHTNGAGAGGAGAGSGSGSGSGSASGSSGGRLTPSQEKGPLFIHFMRHGHVHNPKQVYYGRLPRFRLSDKGLKQAVEGAKYITDEAIDDMALLKGVFVSPMLRARQTAGALSRHHAEVTKRHVPLQAMVTPQLNEIHTPSDGMSVSYFNSAGWHNLYTHSGLINEAMKAGHARDIEDEVAAKLFDDLQRAGRLPGGPAGPASHERYELFPDVFTRVQGVIQDMRERHASGHIILVSHGDCLLSARMLAAGLPGTTEARRKHGEEMRLPTASVVTLRAEPDGTIVEHRVWSPAVAK